MQQFDQAWALFEQASQLYPSYIQESQTEQILLQKWLTYIDNQPSSTAGENHTANKIVFSRYSKWLEQAELNSKPLTDADYNFGIYSLQHMGEDERAIALYKQAISKHPESTLLQN